MSTETWITSEASNRLASSCTISSGTFGPIITGFPCQIIPALSLVISSLESPSKWQWSSPIEVRIAISQSKKLVDEVVPPTEHSITAHSHS